MKGVLLPKPEDCPEWIYEIMLNCWKKDADDRISFTRALQMLKGQHVNDGNQGTFNLLSITFYRQGCHKKSNTYDESLFVLIKVYK